MSDYLLTSPLESSWRLSNKNYILNNFASRNLNLKQNKEFIYIEPFYKNVDEIKKNENYINELSEKILNDLSFQLNKIHNTNYSQRYWKIITGNWINKALKVIFYRYKCLENAFDKKLNLFTTASNIGDYNFFTSDTMNFQSGVMDSEWNFNLISFILRKNFYDKIDIKYHKSKNVSLSSTHLIKKEKKKFYKIFLKKILNKSENFLYFFYKKNRVFFKDSYLTRFDEIKMNLLLKQFPMFFFYNSYAPNSFDKNLRYKIILEKKTDDNIENLIRCLLPNMIPTSYLENYIFIKENTYKLKWPLKPKVIITANAYEFDEIFKFWSAEKIEEGSKYFIFQHGSLHGNHIRSEQTNEYQVCDKFFYWGSKFKNDKSINAFNFKLTDNVKIKKKIYKTLIICKSNGYEQEVYDRSLEHTKLFNGLEHLLNALPKDILNNLNFRIKKEFKINKENDLLIKKNLRIINSKDNILDHIKKSKLVIHMYNSTGVLECLALNIPTMFFCPDIVNKRNYYDDDIYAFCKNHSILFDNIQNLTENLIKNSNEHNLLKWWHNEKLQKERKVICEKYSLNYNKNSLKDLCFKIENEIK